MKDPPTENRCSRPPPEDEHADQSARGLNSESCAIRLLEVRRLQRGGAFAKRDAALPAIGSPSAIIWGVGNRRPGEGRYARVEREQRWIVDAVPREAQRFATILDRYILGTRLRLRRMDTDSGVVLKLGQKVRAASGSPEVVKLTSVYLSSGEYDVLAALPAAEVLKTRWHLSRGDAVVAVDQFDGRLKGLVLAEVELGAHEVRHPLPPFARRDVTDDDRFSGGALAFASDDAIVAVLHEATTSERQLGD